jgi:hypothetical protein
MGAGAGPFDQAIGEERGAVIQSTKLGMPKLVPRASPVKPTGQRPTKAMPCVIMKAQPLAIAAVPSVMISEGMRSTVTPKPLIAPSSEADRERSGDRDQRRVLRLHQPAADDGRQARDLGDREIELGDGEGEREAERQDGEESSYPSARLTILVGAAGWRYQELRHGRRILASSKPNRRARPRAVRGGRRAATRFPRAFVPFAS